MGIALSRFRHFSAPKKVIPKPVYETGSLLASAANRVQFEGMMEVQLIQARRAARKGEAAMRSARRATAVMVLLTLLLAPGVAQAGTLVWSWERATEIIPESFLNKVWSLLAFWRGSDAASKDGDTGGSMDPAGQPAPPSASSACDSGGSLDPAGEPCK